ncbi:4-(cytidine 5'-diphospho)-2-C-methyl-D-erythritol kinase [Phaeovulum sp.]|uniref:4-(cytidine 5'-diphospho)-2-C-methyl-D-erythritol kinase n=1 Tax=Phaeovulum sp. TaxID=2934796 RepID=UPI0039E62CD3
MHPTDGPAIEVLAPAKINLTLHVTGQRADGYHLLDSLVTFAPVADRLEMTLADDVSLIVDGPEAAGVPSNGTNLAAAATYALAESSGRDGRVAMRLIKNLPPASGIGGGSSDAAAAIRGAMHLWDLPEIWQANGNLAVEAHWDALSQLAIVDLAALGADVPMCYQPRPARVQGIGGQIAPLSLPPLPAVLANPRVEVATPAVFKALRNRQNPPMPAALPTFTDATALIDWLATQRNDLQAPAIAIQPVIATVLAALAGLPGCRLARMSGSGATCFALFATEPQAKAAHTLLRAAHPQWWTACGPLGNQTERAKPRPRQAFFLA